MWEVKDVLAAIFCLLIGRDVQVLGDTYELKYKPSVFDDQYIGCVDKLSDDVMPRILRKEKASQQFGEAWRRATKVWNKMVSKLPLPDDFEDEHGIALLVFTNQFPEGNPIYKQLNANLTAAGASTKDYVDNFHFKALHFYLTRALQILKPDCRQNHTAFRGSWDTFKASPLFNFGRFTSTSLNSTEAKTFGQETFFQITTCFGAKIGDFSFFPQEDEVLIPPTEKFTYAMKTNSTHILESSGQMCSYFNCAIMGGEKLTEAICHSDASKLKKIGNIKKNKASAPASEHEERISTLEDLTVRNHQEWDQYRQTASLLTQLVLENERLIERHRVSINYLHTQLEDLTSQNQHSPYADVIQQTSNIINLLLKQELMDRESQLEENKERLDAISTKLDAIQEYIWNAKLRLGVVEETLQTDRTRVTDVRESNSHTLTMVRILQQEIKTLQVSRDDLRVTVHNITFGLTIVAMIGISILINRFRSALQ